VLYPEGNPGADLRSISHRCYLREISFAWDLTEETYICPWVVSRVASNEETWFGVRRIKGFFFFCVALEPRVE